MESGLSWTHEAKYPVSGVGVIQLSRRPRRQRMSCTDRYNEVVASVLCGKEVAASIEPVDTTPAGFKGPRPNPHR